MWDRDAQFLDALYLGVRDRTGFERSLDVLCGLFEVQSAALLDFDAARPDISVHGTANAGDGLSIDRASRPFTFEREAGIRLAGLEADVRGGGAGGVVRVPRADGKPPYAVMVAPYVSDEAADIGKRQRRGVIVVVHDPLRCARPHAETIAALFGLPPGTANLVAAIAANEDLAAYAERAGISMNTVHYHMKAAYARTAVKRQSELVRLVIAALRDLADHRDEEP